MPRNYRIKSAIYRRRKKQRAARDKNRTRRGGGVGARAFVSQDKPKDKNVLNGTSVFCLSSCWCTTEEIRGGGKKRDYGVGVGETRKTRERKDGWKEGRKEGRKE